MKIPELLLPAGGLERMRVAYDYGADAVYAGLPRYSLRARNNEFSHLRELSKGIQEAHQRGKKFYVAANILAHNAKLRTFLEDMAPILELQPDALIMADPGLISKVKENWPDMPIHLSVQANTTNYWGVDFWHSLGISRIILSRELSLEEIAEIRENCPDIELEVFVHGALCIAYSGRCLLSGYFNHRDPNQATSTNACRWNYSIHPTSNHEKRPEGETSTSHPPQDLVSSCDTQIRHPLANQVYYLEETNRKGALLPIIEDEHGTYIMNSKDLRAVENIAKLVQIGVDSFKIEGRTKSEYYVARVAQVYRQAIDDALAHRPFNYSLLTELEGLANRGYTTGFLDRHPPQDYQNYLTGHSVNRRSIYVGKVLAVGTDGWGTVEVKNKFAVGDQLEVIHPQGNEIITLTQIKYKQNLVEEARGNGMEVSIPQLKGKNRALLARIIPNTVA
ncbi:MAG: tRNA 5-hydroxyuridine modification protein YegQ [Neisseriaceae bacterium]